jgi:rare lipoprotein A
MGRSFALGCITASVLLTGSQGIAWARGACETHPAIDPPAVDNSDAWLCETGTASFYGVKEDGRRSASGLRFDKRLMTAAHPWLPFGTLVRVTLGATGRSIIVTITDRLYSRHRIVDLSVAAARELGIIRRGVAQVTLAPA